MSNCYNELLSIFNSLPLPMDCTNLIKDYTYVFECKCPHTFNHQCDSYNQKKAVLTKNYQCSTCVHFCGCTNKVQTFCQTIDLANLKKEFAMYRHCESLKINFGKHKGKYYYALPDGYVNWLETKGILKGDIKEYFKLSKQITNKKRDIYLIENKNYD